VIRSILLRTSISPATNMSRIAVPFLTRSASRYYSTTAVGTKKLDMATFTAAAKEKGYSVQTVSLANIIAYV